MNSLPVQFDKEAVNSSVSNQTYIESTYIFYVPQVVTVRHPLYPQSNSKEKLSCSSSQNMVSDKSFQHEQKAKKVIYLKSKKKKESLLSKKKERKGKINLTSNKSHCNDTSSDQLEQHISSFSRYSQPLPHRSNHIKVDNVIDTMVCNIFDCNGENGIDQFERKSLNLSGSTSTREKVDIKFHPLRSPVKNIQSSRESCYSLVDDSFKGFSKRKNIFQSSTVLNASIDDTTSNRSQHTQRSKSRRGIFQKKKDLNESLSVERSLSKRRKIFRIPSPDRSPKFGIRKQEEFLELDQIPKCVLESWEKFSESEDYEAKQNRLQTVRESCMEESAPVSRQL